MGEPEATEEGTKLTKSKYKKTADGGEREVPAWTHVRHALAADHGHGRAHVGQGAAVHDDIAAVVDGDPGTRAWSMRARMGGRDWPVTRSRKSAFGRARCRPPISAGRCRTGL